MLIAPKWLKIRTVNLAGVLREIVRACALKKSCEKGARLGSRDPIILWASNANCVKIAKDTNFKFGTHDPRDTPYMTPEKN